MGHHALWWQTVWSDSLPPSLKSQPFHGFFAPLLSSVLFHESRQAFVLSILSSFQSLLHALWAVITISYFTNVLIDVGLTFVLLFFFPFFLLFLFTKAALVEWQNDMANDDQLWSIIWTEQCTRHNYNHVVCMWMFKLPFPWIFTKESYILFS